VKALCTGNALFSNGTKDGFLPPNSILKTEVNRERVRFMAPQDIVIVGAGQAATQAAVSLRAHGFAGTITMIGDESGLPYQRPPLSKAYLSGTMSLERVTLKPAESWLEDKVDVIVSTSVTSIDRAAKNVTTANGRSFSYDSLIIATGSRVRKIPCAGADLTGVHYLRTVEDVDGLREEMVPGNRLVVIGGGYIGLEVAAVARKAGLEVTILEAADRVLARVAPPVVSAFFEGLHRDAGVNVMTGAKVTHIEGATHVTGVALADGRIIAADAVLVGIGIIPNAELAHNAGIVAPDGIETDKDSRTSDPNIFAIGDCASRPLVHYGDRRARLESVHNALEQGKLAAAAILGLPRPSEETPWFWSDQYDIKLQIAGISTGATQTIIRGDPATKRFAAFHLDAENYLLGVDAINAPPEFIVAKQVISRHGKLAPKTLTDMSISMKEIGASATT
jgi:3-phenylpropionate/trans-cinnamate dioxygenase ferredoxin reductase subunit